MPRRPGRTYTRRREFVTTPSEAAALELAAAAVGETPSDFIRRAVRRRVRDVLGGASSSRGRAGKGAKGKGAPQLTALELLRRRRLSDALAEHLTPEELQHFAELEGEA